MKIYTLLRSVSLSITITLLAFNLTVAQNNTSLTPEMIASIKTVSGAHISPDGKNIIYTLRVPRSEEDEYGSSYTEIWNVTIDGKKNAALTTKPVNCWSPVWISNSEISFLSKQEEQDKNVQIYVTNIWGEDITKISQHTTSIGSYAWSPDGKWIVYTSTDAVSEEEKAAKKKGKDWIIPDMNYRYSRLWVMNIESKEITQVFEQDINVWSFHWSPDSKSIAFYASKTPNIDDAYMFQTIYTIKLFEEKLPKKLCTTEGKLGGLQYSPDGSQIAFLGATSLNDPLAQTLYVVSAGGGQQEMISVKDEQSSGNGFTWISNDEILLHSTVFSETKITKINLTNDKRTVFIRTGPIISRMDFQMNAADLALLVNTPEHPSEVYKASLKKGKITRLTFSNPELDNITLTKQEIIEWPGSGEWINIEGILTYPADYEEGKRYPLILQIHGGPEGVSLNGWRTRTTYPVQLFAEEGYFVLEPNYRGSGGRGVKFSKSDHNDLGGEEFQDVLKGIDALVESGKVDRSRVGTGGWSYGGYFSALAATKYSDRFKAAMVGAGLTNWISFANTTDIPHEMSLVHWNSYWYDEPQLHWERSPISSINEANTPTLVGHGKNYTRVHPEQSMELYSALKLKGVATKLILYPREPHGLREYAHQVHYMNELLTWYDKYVKNPTEN
ncbi:MAG: S9 family peptidase [Bacteroidetes bacterium]|nr:S9 family peptidase [Bacteroidota bacterium]